MCVCIECFPRGRECKGGGEVLLYAPMFLSSRSLRYLRPVFRVAPPRRIRYFTSDGATDEQIDLGTFL